MSKYDSGSTQIKIMSHSSREPAVEIFNMYLLYCIRFQFRFFELKLVSKDAVTVEALKDAKIPRHIILILGSDKAVPKIAGHKNVHCEL
jgi:hypothetical protein